MKSISSAVPSKLKDCSAGTLVFTMIDDQHVTALVLDRIVEDGDTVLLALLRSDAGEPARLRWADRDNTCVSYGSDWCFEPDERSLLGLASDQKVPFGAVALAGDGWPMKMEGNRSAEEWWDINSGTPVHPPRKGYAYTKWSVWQSSHDWNNPRAQPLALR